jgi:hypothetical protein
VGSVGREVDDGGVAGHDQLPSTCDLRQGFTDELWSAFGFAVPLQRSVPVAAEVDFDDLAGAVDGCGVAHAGRDQLGVDAKLVGDLLHVVEVGVDEVVGNE